MRTLLVTSWSHVSGAGLLGSARGSRASLRPMLNALRFLRWSRLIESLIAQAMLQAETGMYPSWNATPSIMMLAYSLDPSRCSHSSERFLAKLCAGVEL